MPISANRCLRSYIIGLAIGDGNLSNPNGRAVRLRITCDTKHPHLIKKIITSLGRLLPKNKISMVISRGNYINISAYSNSLEPLLGLRAKGGSKFVQNVSVPAWITKNQAYVTPCIRGLIETDGTIYIDRGYQMVMFSTIIESLADQVFEMILGLGFKPRLYKIPHPSPTTSYKYQIRLARDTAKFLKVIRPLKA